MYNVDDVVNIGRLFLVVAVIATTSFPVLYSFMPWYRSRLGRAIMLKAVAFNMTIWLKVVTTFFLNDSTRPFIQWFNAFALILIGIATFTMTYELWLIQKDQIRQRLKEKNNEQSDVKRSAE